MVRQFTGKKPILEKSLCALISATLNVTGDEGSSSRFKSTSPRRTENWRAAKLHKVVQLIAFYRMLTKHNNIEYP
ncbi:unnamed protein product [Acanthoscelides obtectus]|uniref:Uncharacterized protein n=1 Tax=Acanthoscelides obtectus TaxID=200917 RepID=A0A9P0K111_ACAOB|nr:unnamed protein product [Acanthoscelides obtectus]CAK1629169.1 hypothetical protein AOBTE_LOCUS5610 [Acanthoscelides obtectus]